MIILTMTKNMKMVKGLKRMKRVKRAMKVANLQRFPYGNL
jgi:hypothetical protein